MKNPSLANNPVRPRLYNGFPRLTERINTENTPDNIRLAKELRAVVDEYDGDRVLLGEVFGSPSVLKSFLGEDDGLQLVFLFDFRPTSTTRTGSPARSPSSTTISRAGAAHLRAGESRPVAHHRSSPR